MVLAGLQITGGLILVAAAALKLANPTAAREGLATFGFSTRAAQAAGLWTLVAAEVAIGIGVIAGITDAIWLAAVLTACFALAGIGAIMRGQAGKPCGCFGARSTVGWPQVLRSALLAAGFTALALAGRPELTTDQWLALAIGFCLAACAGLAVVVMALAREVGMLRMRVGPSAALEISGEGPELGARTDLADRIDGASTAGLAAAVFMSEGCPVCQALGPAIESVAAHPYVALATFDEVDDADAWRALGIPGSPYAVAVAPDGVVLAKGTFNNLAQLESILGAAERRAAGQAEVALA